MVRIEPTLSEYDEERLRRKAAACGMSVSEFLMFIAEDLIERKHTDGGDDSKGKDRGPCIDGFYMMKALKEAILEGETDKLSRVMAKDCD